jgi:hypothetical protein
LAVFHIYASGFHICFGIGLLIQDLCILSVFHIYASGFHVFWNCLNYWGFLHYLGGFVIYLGGFVAS